MFVGVTIKRRNTGTVVHEYHTVCTKYGGPNRGIVEVAKSVSIRYSSDWEINCIRLTEWQFDSCMSIIQSEKSTIEKKTGVKFDEVSTK
jgi:hypothetical protein